MLWAQTDWIGIATVIAALGSAIAAVIAAWYSAKAHVAAEAAKEDIRKVEIATNSMKDQLVLATRQAGELKGRADERRESGGKP